jgi:hypothetical protein
MGRESPGCKPCQFAWKEGGPPNPVVLGRMQILTVT